MCSPTQFAVQVQRSIIALAASTIFVMNLSNPKQTDTQIKVLRPRQPFRGRFKWSHARSVAKQVKLIFPGVFLSCRGQVL